MNKDKRIDESEKRKKRIIESDEYAKVEIIVACDENEIPFSQATIRNCSDYELAKLVICMKTMIRSIERESPIIPIIESTLSCDTETIDIEG